MQITSKGQVTIPQHIRTKLGLLPHTEVEFELVGDHAQIRKAKTPPGLSNRARRAIEPLLGTGDWGGMTTDEIILMMRGAPAPPPKTRRSK